MNPTDTHIERMAETFAERTPYLRRSRDEARTAWRDALEIAREDGALDRIERRMKEGGLVDRPVQDLWDEARDLDAYAEAPTEP